MRCLLLICLLMVGTAHAHTIRVGKGQRITSIHRAISMAVKGDTVLVDKGTYKEGNIIVDKPIVLKGLNQPILDGEGKHEIISVKSPYVVIEGFLVKHSGYSSVTDIAGIKIYNTHHVTVINNTLDNNFFGIYAQGAKHCTITDNHLTAYSRATELSGNGIHCWKSDSMTISGNRVSGHRDGIYFEFVTHSLIEKNISASNNRYGLHFMFSHNNTYKSNTFRKNGAGVAVMFTRNVTMLDNLFEENWGDAAYGILLKEISDSRIEHNRFVNNTTAIYMEGASRINVSRNAFTGNGWALKIQASCMDNHVSNNNFTGNTFDVATNGSLVLNVFNGNYWDKYEGYDLNRDRKGDVPYHPVSMYAMIIERYPPSMLLFRSFMVTLLEKAERVIPSLTPEALKDDAPLMKPIVL
ncbi:nitrous oxide reductase family maturation protein NosD [Chitinophaga tropicalis]|uniref:Nitrous oxide reductase family maturation protein NosD n=1 Tax=Chitinophaga tropicalis TaxID=2683588 RepID=A0A7K1U5L3_9BACT|nr:nitrous oxide reductase family maturation protein NosD [Chitinophaga tropicalis]MVT09566.1 nitrous oxide reductase family maturation protein NosD [Chitinophaga tropicalis]